MALGIEEISLKVREFAGLGAHESALEILSDVPPAVLKQNALLLGAYGSSLARIGRFGDAARAFEDLADLASDQRAVLIPVAAKLYLQTNSEDDVARLGFEAATLASQDKPLVFAVAQIYFRRRDLAAVSGLLDHLDLSKPDQAYFKSMALRSLDRPDDAYESIRQARRLSPHNIALAVEMAAGMRSRMDFDTMRWFDSQMQLRNSDFALSLFRNQFALDRLYWLDDEARQAEPSLDLKQIQRVNRSGKAPRRRRAIKPAGQKLTIGYLSDEFGNFIVLDVIESVLLAHDREKFDIRLFSYTRPDALEARAQFWPDYLRQEIIDIRQLSDMDAAARIAAEGVDILIDLKGLTKDVRHGISLLSDAPVKAVYLGYPASVPGAGFDYLISDVNVTPDSSKPLYAEKLCRLPETQMPNRAFDLAAITPASRPVAGLPEDVFVLGAFNAARKITPRAFDLWMRILRGEPRAVLWITCRGAAAQASTLAEAQRQGVAPERIFFNADLVDFGDYIGRIALCDLVLDTLPYNGHSTTADILRAGAPLITVRGNSYHSRVSSSLLKTMDLEELAVDSDEAYVELALALLKDAERLKGLRNKLEAQRETSVLFNPARMTRHLELGFDLMAERARNGLAPDHIDIPPLEQSR